MNNFRGSRKHILDWIDSPDFTSSFNELFKCDGIILNSKANLYPQSSTNPEELTAPEFLSKVKSFNNCFNFQDWWAPNGGKLPTWDLITDCEINGKQGLLLVEAKAHELELDYSGKKFNSSASLGSQENNEKIGKCIKEASELLNKFMDGFSLSKDKNYQLVNRFTWALKINNELDIPVALVYLGFVGDTYFKDYIKSNMHWLSLMQNYLDKTVPQLFSQADLSSAPFLFKIKSIPVQKISVYDTKESEKQ